MDLVNNFAKVTVDGAYDGSDTEIDVSFLVSNPLPAPPFNAVWWNATDFPDPADDPTVEIVRVTAQDGVTLTITRAQEGTAAEDHALAGKTYKLMAGLTAKVINSDLLGDIFGSGTAILVDTATPDLLLRLTSARFARITSANIELQHDSQVAIGDVEAENTGAHLGIDVTNGRLDLNNLNLTTTQSESATGPVGTVVGKLAIRNESGTIIGYFPIYNSIT